MTLAAPDHCALESELEVLCGLKAQLLCVHPGSVRIRMSLQATHIEVVAEGPGQPRKQRDAKRFNPVDLKCIDIFGVGAPRHAPALCGAEPVVVLSERY